MNKIDTHLLSELRIDGGQREHDGVALPRWVWPALGFTLVLGLLSGAGWWFWSTRAIPVQTATAVAQGGSGTVAPVLQATGYVTAQRQATVSTQITGTLVKLFIEEGDRVKAGQIIARLEDGALRAALSAAQANVQTALAQVTQAQAQLAQSQADAHRQSELLASGMTTRQLAEQSRTTVTSYAAQLDVRHRETEAARAQLAQAQVNFDYTVVRAPFSGVVTGKSAQVGEIVSPFSAGGGFTRTGVGTIVDMDSLEVDVDVSEAYIGQVKADMPAQAVLDAYPEWQIPAHVIAVVPTADRGKATVKVRVALEQKDGRLVPNMAARVSFLGQKADPVTQTNKGVLVPAQAIVQRDGRSVVFVVVESKAVLRAVTPAAQDFGTMKLLPQTVAAGERVVLSPPTSLYDGVNVKSEEVPR